MSFVNMLDYDLFENTFPLDTPGVNALIIDISPMPSSIQTSAMSSLRDSSEEVMKVLVQKDYLEMNKDRVGYTIKEGERSDHSRMQTKCEKQLGVARRAIKEVILMCIVKR
eukprot:3287228-Ditylum_brightwellii.AAC.1